MKDACKTVNKIVEDSKDIEFDREYRIRELIRVVPHSTVGTVKSDEVEGEPTGRYSIFFKDLNSTKGLQDAINDGKTVLVTLKEIGGRPDVIKSEIRVPNVEIKDSTLKEQQKETEAFANY
jgi:hypothetical protein